MRNPLKKVLLCLIGTFAFSPLLKSDCLADLSYLKDCLAPKDATYLDKALFRYTVSGQKETIKMLKQLPFFEATIEKAFVDADIPAWLKYIPLAESRLKISAVSPAGAVGLWQIMPRTGRSLGLTINEQVDERLDTYKASVAAAKYLKQLHQQFDDWLLALAAYNCGASNVRKAQRRSGGYFYHEISRFLPQQTRRYIPRVLTIARIARKPQAFGLSVPRLSSPPVVVTVTKSTRLSDIARYFCMSPTQLRTLNPSFLTGKISTADLPAQVVIPAIVYLSNERISILKISQHLQVEAISPASILIDQAQQAPLAFEKKAQNEGAQIHPLLAFSLPLPV
ncbi:lytic transglycosylase domain-containing protein [Lewinella sp. LCG006]|uniref:lytic transglycosylase domain-containing protein n=1 Tax=Lewinella sp. LCG006 TaxID=3231911 RepID=UPI00346135FF